jgi:hypothetical protein
MDVPYDQIFPRFPSAVYPLDALGGTGGAKIL